MTRLDPSKYDKNGCNGLIACWCYKCTGGAGVGSGGQDTYDAMLNNNGKGRMQYIRDIKGYADNYRYECIACGYTYNYSKGYVDKYAIR